MNHKSNFRRCVVDRMSKMIKLVLFLIVGTTPNIALAVSFSDAIMNPSVWNSILCPNVPSTTANSVFQVSADMTLGNPSPPSLKIKHTYDTRVFVCHLKNGATVDPSEESIDNIKFSMYGMFDDFSTTYTRACIGFRPLIKQGGVFFWGNQRIADTCRDKSYGWKAGDFDLTASDFTRADLDGDAEPQHPDFSCAGTSIDLGFISYNQTNGADYIGTPVDVVGHVDTWSVDVTSPVKCSPQQPSLSITKVAVGPLPWQAGGTGSYQIVVSNADGAIAPGSIIVVKDDGNFPSPPLNLMGINGETGWNCTTSPGQCSYTVPSGSPVPAGTNWTFIVNVSIDSNYGGGEVENCAELYLQAMDPSELQNSSCAAVSIEAFKQPVITKTAVGPMPWQAGGIGSFTLDVTVPSNIPAGQDIAFHDLLPAGFTIVPSSFSPSPSPGMTCYDSTGICHLAGPIAAGTVVSVTFDVQLPSEAGTYKNCAEVTLAANFNPDSQWGYRPVPQQCIDVVLASPPMPPTIEKTVLGPIPWQAGGTGQFSLAVNVPYSIPAGQAIAIQDVLPAGFTIVSSSLVTSPSTGWQCVQSSGTCYLDGPIAANSNISIVFDVQVPEASGTYLNCAEVAITNPYNVDSPPAFNALGKSCKKVDVNGALPICIPASLNITKSHLPNTFISGSTGTITINVTNTGSNDVYAPIQIVDELPSGLSMNPGLFSPAADVVCTAGSTTPSPQQISCAYMGAQLNAGGSFSFNLQVNVSPRARKIVKNHASVTKGCCGAEVNDKTTDNIPIRRIIIGMSKKGMICGKKINPRNEGLLGWAITATNNSPPHSTYGPVATNGYGKYCIKNLPAGNYTVREQIPGLLNGWVWEAVNPASGKHSNVDLAPGEAKLGVNFKNRKIRTIVNTDSETLSGRTPPSPRDILKDGRSKPMPTGGGISITKKHSPSRFSTGSRGVFKIVVKNKGAKLAKGMLTVVDHMPTGLSVKTGDFRANSWRCKGGMVSSNGQDVTCTYNRALGKNSRATLNLNVTVASANRFPVNVNELENCATASVKESPEMAVNRGKSHINGDVKVENAAKRQGMAVRVCDKVKIRHAKNSGSFSLPIGIGIGLGGLGGGGGAKQGVAR